MIRRLMILLLLAAILSQAQNGLLLRSRVSALKENAAESPEFRGQALTEDLLSALLEQSGGDGKALSRLLTLAMLRSGFSPEQPADADCDREECLYRRYKPEEYRSLRNAYEAVWADAEYFPVASARAYYEDTWEAPRTYGGDRVHEGTDIFGEEDRAGIYPIVSMTDGVVEQVGWLPLGGYRIGIRSPHGGYFYYCHFSSYDRDFRPGDPVRAGEVLGFMGNTGYGGEGTSGKFPVHLHLGIYIATEHFRELSVNPYWVLRAVEARRIVYGAEKKCKAEESMVYYT